MSDFRMIDTKNMFDPLMDDKEPLSQTDESKTVSTTDDESKTRSRTERKPRQPTQKKKQVPKTRKTKIGRSRNLLTVLPISALIFAVVAFALLGTLFKGEIGDHGWKIAINAFIAFAILDLLSLVAVRKGFSSPAYVALLLLIGITNFILPFRLKHIYATTFYLIIGVGAFCSLCLSIINFYLRETPRAVNLLFDFDVYAFSLWLHWTNETYMPPMSERTWDRLYVFFSAFVFILFIAIMIIKNAYYDEQGKKDD